MPSLSLSSLPVSRLRALPGPEAHVCALSVTAQAITLLYHDGGRVHCSRDRTGLFPFSSEFLSTDRHVVTGWYDPIFVLGNRVVFEILRARAYESGGILWMAEYRGQVS